MHTFILSAILIAGSALPRAHGATSDAASDSWRCPPIASDRPSFTPTTAVIPTGHVQLELGLSYAHAQGTHSAHLPELWLRYGLPANIELRIQVPTASISWHELPGESQLATTSLVTQTAARQDGLVDTSDWSLGAKLNLPVNESLALAVIPALHIPTTFGYASDRGLGIALDIAWSIGLSDTWSLGGVIGASLIELGGDQSASFNSHVAVIAGMSISEVLGAYLESFITYAQNDDRPLPHAAIGLSWLLRPRLQLDAHAGFELTASDSIFAGIGLVTIF